MKLTHRIHAIVESLLGMPEIGPYGRGKKRVARVRHPNGRIKKVPKDPKPT